MKISQNSQENICARVSFLKKLQAKFCIFIKKETLAQVFSSENCKIFIYTFYYRTPPDDCFWINCNIVRIETKKVMNKQYHRVGFRTWQTSTMEHFTKILSNWKTLINFAKRPVLDVWQSSKCASIISNIIVINWLIIYLSLLCRLPKWPSQECNHSIWYLLFSNLHPCLQDSDIGWNYMEEHLHRDVIKLLTSHCSKQWVSIIFSHYSVTRSCN